MTDLVKPNYDDIKNQLESLDVEQRQELIDDFRKKTDTTLDVLVFTSPYPSGFTAGMLESLGNLIRQTRAAGTPMLNLETRTQHDNTIRVLRQMTDVEVWARMIDREYYRRLSEYNKAVQELENNKKLAEVETES